MLRLDNVSKRYQEGGTAIQNLTLSIRKGEMVFVSGHSGAGKSTLLKLIALIERCSQGQIIFDRQNLTRLPERKIPWIRRKIGLIFQDFRLLHDRTVFDNVALPLIIAGYSSRDIGRRVRAALDKVGLLSKEKRYPMVLSGGEQQRVGIARAIVNKPPMILADEPTGNLDPELSREIMELFKQFNQVGVTLLIASHDLALVSAMGHRTICLDRGELVGDSGSVSPC